MTRSEPHHIFYPARRWRGGVRQQLREHRLAIVELDRDGHQRLHHNLRSYEGQFYPRVSQVLGMLALADNQAPAGSGLDDVLARLDQWQAICRPQDLAAAFILGQQAIWIERGWCRPGPGSTTVIGGLSPASSR